MPLQWLYLHIPVGTYVHVQVHCTLIACTVYSNCMHMCIIMTLNIYNYNRLILDAMHSNYSAQAILYTYVRICEFLQVIIVDWSTPEMFHRNLRAVCPANGFLTPTCVVETTYGKTMLNSINQFYQKKKKENTWYTNAHIKLVVAMETESVA